jgi:hypothetical protein
MVGVAVGVAVGDPSGEKEVICFKNQAGALTEARSSFGKFGRAGLRACFRSAPADAAILQTQNPNSAKTSSQGVLVNESR